MQFDCHNFFQLDFTGRSLHYYIEEGDTCFYMGEYTSCTGFAHSPMNNLISNFKKKLTCSAAQLGYKEEAIENVADILRRGVPIYPVFNGAIFVPTPPSASKGDPNYDNRLIRALSSAEIEYREIVLRKQSRPGQHTRDDRRLPPIEHAEEYFVDTSTLEPQPSKICIFDDVLTTGSTFKAMEIKIREYLPAAQVFGFFIARRIINS